ncbi:hypothetical protein CK203_011251 [Vitis vinifera]|uniref:Endonuclease/exonuclease/phosphatase domain-containing protein n=1 Tax=Vitis vinifera TaxID=29760 RepID=A0A438JYD7_VITVI|nr:hypothetical protein CK203_011251 [Vitis vinifera]
MGSCRFKGRSWRGLWPNIEEEQGEFLGKLGALKGLWNGSWCVAGDFNVILSPEEHSRGGSLNSNMRRFSEVIEDLELKDLPMVGAFYLDWRGNTSLFSRLDPFLVNEGVGQSFW